GVSRPLRGGPWLFDNSAAVRVASHGPSAFGGGSPLGRLVSREILFMSPWKQDRAGSLLPLPPAGRGDVAPADLSVARGGRGRGQRGQATKGVWGMSWRQEATKGVEDCDKPGGTVNQVLIPGCPNHPRLNP